MATSKIPEIKIPETYKDITNQISWNGAFSFSQKHAWVENKTVHVNLIFTVSTYIADHYYDLATIPAAYKADGTYVGTGLMTNVGSQDNAIRTYIEGPTLKIAFPNTYGTNMYLSITWHI